MQYLFIVIPNNSASTLVKRQIAACPNVCSLQKEGQWYFNEAGPLPNDCLRVWTEQEARFIDSSRYDWEKIQARWHEQWSKQSRRYGRPDTLLLEKSPPNVLRARILQQQFPDARFVLSIRNPYAVCEGMKRRVGYDVARNAQHWLRCATWQVENIKSLKRHLFFRYEDLCDHRLAVQQQLREFLPECSDLSLELSIANRNPEQIARLERGEIQRINEVLLPEIELLRHFGYEIIRADSLACATRTSDSVPLQESPTAAARTQLWTSDELEKATGGRWFVPPRENWNPASVSYDINSRIANHLIITKTPLSWGRQSNDTSLRLDQVAAKGAVGAIIQQEQLRTLPALPDGFPLLLVPNTRFALRDLALAARARFQGKVICVTGTVGKTTTREMLRALLGKQGGAEATRGNNNNLAGVLRTLSYVPRDLGYAIVECGFGLPLRGLGISSSIAQPHVAVFTSLGIAHLDVFDEADLAGKNSLDVLAEYKSLIFEGLVTGGVAVICRDMPAFEIVASRLRRRDVGSSHSEVTAMPTRGCYVPASSRVLRSFGLGLMERKSNIRFQFPAITWRSIAWAPSRPSRQPVAICVRQPPISAPSRLFRGGPRFLKSRSRAARQR